MQLRTANGYRAIHCKGCKKQETVARTKCQCNVIWHRCETHRIDPATHSSRKGRKGVQKKPQANLEKEEGIHGSKRKAPLMSQGTPPQGSSKKRRSRKAGEEDLTSHARRVLQVYPPSKAAINRLKRKLEKEKEDKQDKADQKQKKGTFIS